MHAQRRSVTEAEEAAKLVPFDPFSRADLVLYMANAGKIDTAIEWLEESIRRDASPLGWYFGNLAFAYYRADRPADAVTTLQKMVHPWYSTLAAAHARLGHVNEARAGVETFLQEKPGWTVGKEAVWPSTK